MRLRYLKTVLLPQECESSVVAQSWSPNSKKLAIATSNRHILLVDKNGEIKDQFQTKPSSSKNGKKSYMIQTIAFSPESIRLAVAQTDSIVYVYKLGELWTDKKVICNKFHQISQIICLVWTKTGFLICGLLNGQVNILNTRSNKTEKMYSSESAVLTMCSYSNGDSVLTGHEDSWIIRHIFNKNTHEKLFKIQATPSWILWSENFIVVANCTRKVLFYDKNCVLIQQIDYSNCDGENDFSSFCVSPSKKFILIGSFSRLLPLYFNTVENVWQQLEAMNFHNFYTTTSLSWSSDGTKISCGTLLGSVILLNPGLKRIIWKNIFEVLFLEANNILIKSLDSDNFMFKIYSKYSNNITEFDFCKKNRYFICKTEESLLVADIISKKKTEIIWPNISKTCPKMFYNNWQFKCEDICSIMHEKNLRLISLAKNEIVWSVKSENLNMNKFDTVILENKVFLAYLENNRVIKLIDTSTKSTVCCMNHNLEITWIKLGSKLKSIVFFDIINDLYVYNIKNCTIQNIAKNASFFKYVSLNTIFVQCKGIGIVWYDFDIIDNFLLIEMDHKIENVKRKNRDKLLVFCANNKKILEIDDDLYYLKSSIETNDIRKIFDYCFRKENLELSLLNLAQLAMKTNNYFLSKHSYSTLRSIKENIFFQCFLNLKNHNICLENDDIKNAIVIQDFLKVEEIFLNQNDLKSAILVHKSFNKWEDVFRLVQKYQPENLQSAYKEYIEYLRKSRQIEKIAEFYMSQKNYEKAVSVYLESKMPNKALSVFEHVINGNLKNDCLFEELLQKFTSLKFFEFAGDLCMKYSKCNEAIEHYKNGKCYYKLLKLAKYFKTEELQHFQIQYAYECLEKEKWEEAVDYFFKSHCFTKALPVAIKGKLWKTAFDIATKIEKSEIDNSNFEKLADYFVKENDFEKVEYLLMATDKVEILIEILLKNTCQYEKAYELANKRNIDKDVVNRLFILKANDLMKNGDFSGAEQIFLSMNEVDLAIDMYKNNEKFDDMIRLVETFHPNLLKKTHYLIAKHLENKKLFDQAKKHYLYIEEWKKIVDMYQNEHKWDEAYEIAYENGGKAAANQVLMLRSRSLPISSAKKFLQKHKLLDECITFACKTNDFKWAFQLCDDHPENKEKLNEIHFEYGKKLFIEGKYCEAEKEYLLANRLTEIINMYVDAKDYQNAIRVAESSDQAMVNSILTKQALEYFDQKNFSDFESIFLRIKSIDDLINHYKKHEMWEEALKICKKHKKENYLSLLNEFNEKSCIEDNVESIVNRANVFINAERYKEAVNYLMKITPEMVEDELTLKTILLKVAEIVTKFFTKKEASEISKTLGHELMRIGEPTAAAKLYIASDKYKEAIDVMILHKDWKRAKTIARKFDTSLEKYIDMKSEIAVENINPIAANEIDFDGCLNQLLAKNDWASCFEKIENSVSPKKKFVIYFELFVRKFLMNDSVIELLKLFQKHGIHNSSTVEMTIDIARKLFAFPDFTSKKNEQILLQLRNKLFSEWVNMHLLEKHEQDDLYTYLMIAHFYTVRGICCEKKYHLEEFAAKISISLLRFCHILPADKVFYEAATDLKKLNRAKEAFIFYNCYLDICESIKECKNLFSIEIDGMPHLPKTVRLPNQLHLKDSLSEYEAVRQWVLELISMEHQSTKKLPLNKDNKYESYLVSNEDFCIITGYPLEKQVVSFEKSKLKANRECWAKLKFTSNKITFRQNSLRELLNFIEMWCGKCNFSYV